MELPGGNYHVLYRLKISDSSGTDAICKLYVRATRSGVDQEIASAELRPCDFHRAGAWETFALPVEIRDDDEDVRIGVEFYSGLADLWCDWIRLVLAEEHLAGDIHVLGALKASSLWAGGAEVISSGRALKNVITGVLNMRAFERGAGENDVNEEVEPHEGGRQFIPLAVEATVGDITRLVHGWEVLDQVGDGKRITKWLISLAYDELADRTRAIVKALDADGMAYLILEISDAGDRAGSVKIRAVEI